MSEYPWYEKVSPDQQIKQGDFICSCPVIIPPDRFEPGEKVPAKVHEYNVIVLSQSCDLVQGKIDLVLVCPIWSLDVLGEQSEIFKSTKGRESLRKGDMPGYHLLNQCDLDEPLKMFMVVDFRSIYSVPFEFLKKYALTIGDRVRLLPPYREHLSQAFARFFMRVGLPVDIPSFKKK